LYIPDDGLGFKGRNVGFCQQLINFIDDKSTDGWTMSNNTNTIICGLLAAELAEDWFQGLSKG